MVTQMVTTEQEAPVLITVAEAERLCSLPEKVGYKLVRKEWAAFVVKAGENRIRINRQKLLEWANGQKAA